MLKQSQTADRDSHPARVLVRDYHPVTVKNPACCEMLHRASALNGFFGTAVGKPRRRWEYNINHGSYEKVLRLLTILIWPRIEAGYLLL
jgi:hypothetical protein